MFENNEHMSGNSAVKHGMLLAGGHAIMEWFAHTLQRFPELAIFLAIGLGCYSGGLTESR
jgi:hypothetical protein